MRMVAWRSFRPLTFYTKLQEIRRRADTCVAAANAMTKYVYRRLDGDEVDAEEVRHLQYLWRSKSGSVLRSVSSVSHRSVTSLGSDASRLKAAAELLEPA